MDTTTFGKRLDQAATDLPGATSTAWVQYGVEADGETVTVRMQAPEIMKEFSGSVDFGTGRSNWYPYIHYLLTSSRSKGYFIFRVRRRP